jgi:hypothetical protein
VRYSHGENAKEFILMRLVCPSMKTIQAATIVNAEILEMDTKIRILEPDVLQILLQQNDDPTKDINRN